MTLEVWVQWSAFAIFTFISLAGALGMATTMSMFRSGIFLMASFIGVAGLFILLLADLLALLQVMMYIGGMLVMILFMVMFSHDPGGAMMAGMKMSVVENFFSKGIRPQQMGGHAEEEHQNSPDKQNGGSEHGGHQEQFPGGEEKDSGENHNQEGGGHMGMQIDMQEMSMSTPIKKFAAILALVGVAALWALLLIRRPWPVTAAMPDTDSAAKVGHLLMGKYMMAFEGAGLLILIGIFGAVLVGRAGRFPDRSGRDQPVAVDDTPAPIEADRLQPAADVHDRFGEMSSADAHQDES